VADAHARNEDDREKRMACEAKAGADAIELAENRWMLGKLEAVLEGCADRFPGQIIYNSLNGTVLNVRSGLV